MHEGDEGSATLFGYAIGVGTSPGWGSPGVGIPMHGETPSQVVRLIYWCGDVPRLGSPHQWGSPGWGSPGGVLHLPIYPTVVVPYPDRYTSPGDKKVRSSELQRAVEGSNRSTCGRKTVRKVVPESSRRARIERRWVP